MLVPANAVHAYPRRLAAALAIVVALALPAAAAHAHDGGHHRSARVDHIVVVFQENHSFDNLYGSWEGVNGLADADAAHTTQVGQGGVAYTCLKQNDVKLTSPPLPATCTDTTTGSTFQSAFRNEPFAIDDYIAPEDLTCPKEGVNSGSGGVPKQTGNPGGCTRDLVHRFYQEQYQINGGLQNRYVTGSDAVGLTMGHYDTRALPIYKYLHGKHAPNYVIADHFFQAAFGGSFLNHQWLIAAASPVFYGAVSDGSSNDLHSLVDRNGMPTSYPLYTSPDTPKDAALTVPCGSPNSAGVACGSSRRLIELMQ